MNNDEQPLLILSLIADFVNEHNDLMPKTVKAIKKDLKKVCTNVII